jgi:hypothetical protein
MLNSTKIVFLSFFSESEGKFYVYINEFVENFMEINILFTELKKLFDLSKYISKTEKNLKNDIINKISAQSTSISIFSIIFFNYFFITFPTKLSVLIF